MRAWRAALCAGGAAILATGIAGLLRHATQTRPAGWLEFVLGGLVAHDALLVPVVALVSWSMVRWVPRRVRPAATGGLFVAGSLAVVSIPVVGGYGRLANNPSLLPSHHYLRALLLCVVVVGALTALAARRARAR